MSGQLVITAEYGVLSNHRVDAVRVFDWKELQRLLIQAAVDERLFYGGTWGGQVSIRAGEDGVVATVRIWKEQAATEDKSPYVQVVE